MIKKIIIGVIMALSIAVCPILYIFVGPQLTDLQLDTLKILLIICGCSWAYCFIVGEITRNNSQMDKLWSILPIAYTWVIAIKGNMSARLVVIAILVTLWGARLTFNFARKGAYSIKFWTGVEDYRWVYLRNTKMFQARWKWTLFNMFFISLYQNLLVLIITLPALASMENLNPFSWIDILATVLALFFLIYEIIADEQQWKFQTKKYELLNGGKKLEELPSPYNKGFNTTGLWGHCRHPNYLGEQGFWVSLFIYSISALLCFNWSFIGSVLIVALFIGSSTLGEALSSSKYPEYKNYQAKVSRFFFSRKYRD